MPFIATERGLYVTPSGYAPTQWTTNTNTITENYYSPSTTNNIWANWVTTSNTITISTTCWDNTWVNWINDAQTYQPLVRVPTAEQILAREAERCERQRTRQLAHTKARRLLEMVLSDEQRSELDRHERFHVRGSSGRRYCVNARGQAGNVTWVGEDGEVYGRFCAHPGEQLPDADAWLAQALALETDDDAFLAVANLQQGRRPDPVLDAHVPVLARR